VAACQDSALHRNPFPRQTLLKLFGAWIQFFCFSFDRVVTEKGQEVGLLLTLWRKRICSPVSAWTLHHRPYGQEDARQSIGAEVDRAMDELMLALAA
jgi:hypothetical protein